MCKTLHKHSSSFPNTTLQTLKLSSSFFLLFLLLHISLSQSSPHLFIYGGCSQPKYQPNSPFQSNLNNLLSSLSNSASQSSYNSLATGNDSSTPPDAAVYGLYQCRGDLSTADCASCVQSAVAQLGLVCVYAYAAGLQLDGCFVRYDNVNFLNRLDTTLMYKKCSPSTSNDDEFFRKRDDVLADMQSGVGFRVRSVGTVEGVSQCMGDLSSSDCSACLSEAVSQLKNVCGSALAADVYLAQCYARYWASGYYSSADSSNEDDVGRTVSIIVGVLAGVAVVIVFLSFLRKAFA
ncbi:plasmodesmata-located protein 8 [Magnolia sinica]|uniref:plasmodesmata-located protein 8 n=1 Tax=Magnolia sinica TaxID=86752 RepID=UPI002659FB19|nr:plasmodesmata-located protein 8 [Magnolia sinica]